MPAFGFSSSAAGGFPPAGTWIPSTYPNPTEYPLFNPDVKEFHTYLSDQQNLHTNNPKAHPSAPHDTSEPPYNPGQQDFSSCFGQEHLISETSSDADKYAHRTYGYGGIEKHGSTVKQEDDDRNKGFGYGDDEFSYDENDDEDDDDDDGSEYGDYRHDGYPCADVKHDYRSAYVGPYASEFSNSSYAAGMHAQISNNGISAYSPSVSSIPAWNRPAATTCMLPPRFSNTWSGLGTTGSLDPSVFWTPSFPWGTYTSVQSPHAYGLTALAQNHYTYGATEGPYAYVGPTPWSTSDLNPVAWTQTIPVADSSRKQTVPDGTELSQSEVHNTSSQESSACHIEGSQAGDTELQGTHFSTPPTETLQLKCHQEIITESISKASCSNEIKADDVSGGESGAQHSRAEPACSPLQSSKDANLSSECEELILSIYNMCTILTDKINKMDNKGQLDVCMLDSTLGLLSLCLAKQLLGDSTRVSCKPFPQVQENIQEQPSKPGVQPHPLATPDNDTAPSVEALLRALSHEKYAQIVEEAVEKSLKMHLEKALKNSMDLLKLQQDILQECSKSNNALCDFKGMLAEAQNVLSNFRFQIPKCYLKLESLASKLKETRISDEHASLDVSGDESDASVLSSYQRGGVSYDKHGLASLSASLSPSHQSVDDGHLSHGSREQQSVTSSKFQGANSTVSEPCLTGFGKSSDALDLNGMLNLENASVHDKILADVVEGSSVKSEDQDGVSELRTSLNRSKNLLTEILSICESEAPFPNNEEVALDSDGEDWEYVA